MNDSPNNTEENKASPSPEKHKKDISLEEKRREDQERVSLEQCKMIRDIGESYRETEDIGEVADEFDLGPEEAEEAVIVYRIILDEPPTDVSFGAFTTAVDFFDARHNIESLTRGEGDEGVERSEEYIREFVGAIYRIYDVESEDEIGEIPDEMKVDMPEMYNLNDIDVPSICLSGFGDIDSFFNHQSTNTPLSDVLFPSNEIDTLLEEEIQGTNKAINDLDDEIEELKIPDDVFNEVIEALNHVDPLQLPPTTSADSVYSQTIVNPAQLGEEQKEFSDKTEGIDEKDFWDIETEELIKSSLGIVVKAFSESKTREWYLKADDRVQSTAVKTLLFFTTFNLTGGNVVVASAIAMVFGPGLSAAIADWIRKVDN